MPKTFTLFVVGAVVLLVSAQRDYASEVQLSEAEIVAKLSTLKPLQKVHYSYTLLGSNLMNERDSRLLYEYTRITHALTPPGEWVNQKQLDNCIYTCARINKTNPKIPASIGAGFSPWASRFGKNLPPTDRGPTYNAELQHFSQRLQLIKKWLAQSNKKYGSNVKLTAIVMDCERFSMRKGDDKWNEGMREALDAIHLLAKAVFPKARIEWYGRGITRSAGKTGWDRTKYFTGKEIKAPLSCSLYTLPELQRMRETFRRTCELADELGIEDVTPYVALGAGYRRGLTKMQYWDPDWHYDIIYSQIMGSELNNKWHGDRPDRYAPYNRAKVVVFYPPPFRTKTPNWAIHFIAYVRGANGIRELKDLGYEE